MNQLSKSIIAICDQIFNEEQCLDIARKNQFIIRSSSRIKGHEFLKVLILPSQGLNKESLVGLCDRMRQFNDEADISAPALAQRINTISAVKFMQASFQELLNLSRREIIKEDTAIEGLLKNFKSVYLQDSTLIELHEYLQKKYPGTKRGTNCCKSQVKIDVIHNFSIGQIVNIGITAGKNPDQALAHRIYQYLGHGDLIIRDLGYFAIEHIKKIEEIGACFLSRLPNHVLVFLHKDDQKPINLAYYLDKYYSHETVIDLGEVYISRQKIKSRLVIYRLPQEEVKKRQHKANKHAKETGRKQSQAKRKLMKFSIFVTNVEAVLLPKESIGNVYRLRWEIELIFKQWKSKLEVHYLKGTNPHRIDCLIWGRLCMVILTAMLIASFMKMTRKIYRRELSSEKLLSYLIRQDKMGRAVAAGKIEILIKRVIQDIPRMLLKNKRSRKTMREKVVSHEPYYENVLCA